MNPDSRICSYVPAISLFCLALAVMPTAYATDSDDGDDFDSPIEGVLQDVTVRGPQRAMGALIEEVCPGGVSRGVILAQDLADRCTDIVLGLLNDGDTTGAQGALEQMAGEEISVVGTTQVDASSAQLDAIGARLSSLRAGGPRVAVSVPGFAPDGVAAASTAGGMSGGAAGDATARRYGFFVNGNYAYNERDTSINESGFESDTYGVTAGADFEVTPSLLLGAAFTYTSADADIVANAGTMETDSYGGFGYGTWTLAPGWYADGMVGYTRNNHDQVRNLAYTVGGTSVNQAALSELDSREVAGSLKLGYDHASGSWVIGPFARLDVADVEIDGYSERMSNPGVGSGLALQIDDQAYTSIMTAFGATLGYVSAQSWGTWFPQVIAEYVHEFDNDAENITGRFVNAPTVSFSMPIDDPDRDFAHVGVSSSFVWNSGVSAFVSYQALVGYTDLDTHVVEFGVRVPF